MISFKTFLKIRYPEWENTILSFEPARPSIDDLYARNGADNQTIDLIAYINNGLALSSYLRKRKPY
jgi:hypothetical protein